MSAHVLRLLLEGGHVDRWSIGHALLLAEQAQCSVVEKLVTEHLATLEEVSLSFTAEGPLADPTWRPDSRCLALLPPLLSARLLAFPFRERGGVVEVSTLSAYDPHVRSEFEYHLRRPIKLYRASVQALLAAAGSSFELDEVSATLPPVDESHGIIPLVRKSVSGRPRARIPTSPGLGAVTSADTRLVRDDE